MSARALPSLACAALLGALACGGDDANGSASVAPPTAEAAPAERAAAPEADALEEPAAHDAGAAASGAGIAPSAESEDRAGDLLDLDPEGEGLDTLIRAASGDPDPHVRETAVIALGDSEDARALDALIAATDDRDERVVLAAIDQLSWFDDRRAEDAIRRLADSPNAEVALAAREELDDE